SKAVFQPRSAGKPGGAGYSKLQCVTLAGATWCGLAADRVRLVHHLAASDSDSITETQWLKTFIAESVSTAAAEPLAQRWSRGVAQLTHLQSRVITAKAFNRLCGGGMNKSDLLSQTTLTLVKTVLDQLQIPDGESVHVFCDRHGGRRYYAGPLQSVFDAVLVQVIAESKTESSYRVPYDGRDFTIRFTVKGDSFTPVAFSSMVAKYLREKAMESLNDYFASLHSGKHPLQPTAGYPVDADRFLADIRPIIKKQNIDLSDLVRSR
ncbi:MAG: hypothetical protein KDB00_14700, partial [Planctomycetales bacterium]|nr:hypothetical protein [Planctomycetales bacterium]